MPAARIAVDPSPEILAAIHEAGCAAAIWDRRLDADLLHALALLPPSNLPRLRACVAAADAGAAVDEACTIAGAPAGGLRAALVADVAALARRFAAIMATGHLHLRLDVVTGDACRRFHCDMVTARLLCSYRGPGTEYGTARVGGDPDPVQRMATGAAGMFRGRLWPGAGCALVHRSPPIAGTGVVRLVLVIDAGDHGHG